MEKEALFELSSNESSELYSNILEFQYSFGYNIQKYFNMCVADECTIVFGSGNLIHIYNVEKEEFKFQRIWTGGGIGHITKNPLFEHIAVANNGCEPVVVIYNWPAMDIISLLKGGTTKMYSFMSYSTDGEMLCVQGGDPDFLLTLWDWKNAVILRQQRSHVNDVYNIVFSPYTSHLMCTGGWKHINFWNIAKTFSGLKLVQNPGRFGKRDASHVIGILPLPDGQVISGCEWGNMLLWSDGVIKMELCGLNGQSCHEAPISQILLEGKELVSVGRDGMINTWYFEEIENADPQEDFYKLEMRPYRSIRIGSETNKSSLVAIAKQYQRDAEDTNWFAQDANGRLWKVNLSQTSDLPAEEIFLVHAGAVVAIAASPLHPLLASLDQSGRLLVHDYSKKKLISHAEFSSRGSSIIWLPSYVDESGCTLVAGFEDGTIHVVKLLLQDTKSSNICTELVDIIETQLMKPHSSKVTKIITHQPDHLLITGSSDASVFLYFMSMKNEGIYVVPIGFCKVPGGVTYIDWKQDERFILKAGCITGHYVEIELNPNLELCSDESLLLKYVTTKEINLVLEASDELDLNTNSRKEGRSNDLNNDECETQNQINNQDNTRTIYVEKYKCPVLHSIETQFSEILLISGGRNAGCIWKYTTEKTEPEYCLPLLDKTGAGISTCLCSVDGKYLIFGTFDGKLCVRSIESSTVNSSSNWFLSMHDNFKGTVTELCFSNDHLLLFSCGEDGNIFSYKFNYNEDFSAVFHQDEKSFFKHVNKSVKRKVNDLLEEDMDISYSLEESMQRKVKEKKLETARKRKEEILRLLEDYQVCFKNIMERNDSLPISQKIPRSYFEIDRRITQDMKMEFQRESDLVRQMMEFRVEKSRVALKKMMEFLIASPGSFIVTLFAVKNKWNVSTMCQQKLGTDFHKAKQAVEQKMKEFELREKWEDGIKSTIREHERRMTQDTILVIEEKRINPIDIALRGVNTTSLEYKLNTKFNRLLDKYQARRNKLENRLREWEKHRKQKPDATKNDPDDIAAIEEAERTIGDFKLKSAQNFSVPRHSCVTFTRKYNQLLAAREKLFIIKEEFNNKVFDLRKEKVILIQKMKERHACIYTLHEELQLENLKHVSSIPVFNMDKEFPEKKFQLQIHEEKEAKSFLSNSICSLSDVSSPYVPLFECGKDKDLENNTNKDYEDSTRNKWIVHFQPACVMSSSNETEDTHHWETEFKEINSTRKLFECDRILKEIDKHIFEFDTKIKKLGEMKISADVEAKFQELHILSLHQELIVLRDYHYQDEEMDMVISEHLSQRHSIQLKITALQNDIESHTRDLEILKSMNKNIQKSFDEAVSQDKFADILRHIFGKRYHQSNSEEAQDSDDNMSLYEDSSSEDDVGNESLTPAAMQTQGIVDNVCPEGCKVELYELTLKLRSDRHSLEERIAEKIKVIEEIKKELETNSKKMKGVEINSKLLQQRYDALQLKKQQMLNRIETVVVLTLHQIQCVDGTNTLFHRMSNKLLFSGNVLQQLIQRVTELQKETDDQKDIQRTNKQHLHRLKIDCNHMENEIGKLKSQIEACMIKKFGQKIDLDKLEEAILQQNISKMKSPANKIKGTYERKIAELKMKIQEKEECLSLARQQNTEKLHVLTILEDQKNKQTATAQNRKIRNVEDYLQKVEEYAADCNKLSLLSKQLNEQADILKREIKILRMKTRPHQLPPLQREKEMFKPFSPADKNENREYLDEKGDIEKAALQAQNDQQETESDKSFTEEEEDEEEETEVKEDHHMGVQNLLENVLKRFTVAKKDKQIPTVPSKEMKDSECVEVAGNSVDNNIRHYVQDLLPAIINEVGQLDISLGLTVIDDIIDKLSYRLELQEDTDNIKYILNQIIIDLSSKDVSNPELAISETVQDLETKEEHDDDDITDVKLILYHIIKDTLTVIAEEDFK